MLGVGSRARGEQPSASTPSHGSQLCCSDSIPQRGAAALSVLSLAFSWKLALQRRRSAGRGEPRSGEQPSASAPLPGRRFSTGVVSTIVVTRVHI